MSTNPTRVLQLIAARIAVIEEGDAAWFVCFKYDKMSYINAAHLMQRAQEIEITLHDKNGDFENGKKYLIRSITSDGSAATSGSDTMIIKTFVG